MKLRLPQPTHLLPLDAPSWLGLTLGLMLVASGDTGAGGNPVSPQLEHIVSQRVATQPGGNTRHELYTVNDDGNAERVLAVSDDDESLEVEGYVGSALEPGKSRVIYSRNKLAGRDLYSVNLDGTDTQVLTSRPSIF